jgi:hypothetical protein
MRVSLPVQTSQISSQPASTSVLINCFVEQLPEDAKSPVLLSRVAGVETLGTVGTGPIYAMHGAFQKLYVVSGTKLYEVDSNYTATELGDVGAISSYGIDMDHNAEVVVVVNYPNAYVYDTTTSTFSQISDPDFLAASDVDFIDNWLLFVEVGTGRFFGADLGSATSFDALNFATAEGNPDDLVGMKVDHRQVVLFGEESVEIWDNTGVPGFPFERAINGFLEIGCFNGRTIAKMDNSIFWLANDYTIRRLDGATPVRVSNHAVEQSIVQATIAAGKAFAWSQFGHFFYVLTFPEVTWVYDATTKTWHNRETYGLDYWTAGSNSQAFGLEIVGNSTSNQIGKLDPLVYDEWGETQRMSWTYQPVYAENRRANHDRLEIVLETGVGLTSGQGSDPQLMLDKSDDGGKTWDSLPNKDIGLIGEYRTRVVWNRLGSARQRVYRAAVSDPIPVNVTDTLINVRGARF